MNTEQLNKLGWFGTRGDINRYQHLDGRTLERDDDGYWFLDGRVKLFRSLSDSATEANKRKAKTPKKAEARS